jgi:hypothetical protein
MRMRWVTLRQTAFAMLGVMVGASAAFADACSDLRAVLAAGADFESVRGPSLPDDRWVVKTKVAGWDKCYLWRGETGLAYNCDSSYFADRGTAQEYVERERAALKRCLAPGWNTVLESSDNLGLSNGKMIVSLRQQQTLNLDMAREALAQGRRMPSAEEMRAWQAVLSVFSGERSRHGTDSTSAERGAAVPRVEAATTVGGPRLCEGLAAVIASARNRFTDLKGEARRADIWASRRQDVGGANACWISVLADGPNPPLFHRCNVGRHASHDAASVQLSSVRDAVRSCLGTDWRMRERTRDGGKRISVYFEKSDSDPSVSLVLRQQSDSSWGISLDVDMADE